MWVQSLGQEGPLEEEMASHSSTLAWEIPWTEGLMGCSPWGRKESDMTATESPPPTVLLRAFEGI